MKFFREGKGILKYTGTTKGFTLIETLLYLALYAIIVGGAVATAYAIAAGENMTKVQINLLQEGNFILMKMEWALSGAQSATVQSNPPGFSVMTADASSQLLFFEVQNGTLVIRESRSGITQMLTANAFTISGSTFTEIPATAYRSKALQIAMDLTAMTNEGKVYTRALSAVIPLRP